MLGISLSYRERYLHANETSQIMILKEYNRYSAIARRSFSMLAYVRLRPSLADSNYKDI